MGGGSKFLYGQLLIVAGGQRDCRRFASPGAQMWLPTHRRLRARIAGPAQSSIMHDVKGKAKASNANRPPSFPEKCRCELWPGSPHEKRVSGSGALEYPTQSSETTEQPVFEQPHGCPTSRHRGIQTDRLGWTLYRVGHNP